MYFLTAHKYLRIVNNKDHCLKTNPLSYFYIQQEEKEISPPEPMCGSECLGTVCPGTIWDKGAMSIFLQSSNYSYIYIYMYACESMTSCTFNTFPIIQAAGLWIKFWNPTSLETVGIWSRWVSCPGNFSSPTLLLHYFKCPLKNNWKKLVYILNPTLLVLF